MNQEPLLSRRRVLRGGLAFGAAMYCLPGAFAEELAQTPRLTEGPFYPDKLPLDKDNDLIVVGDSTTPAVGQITHLAGRILDREGKPVKDAQIEIWQVDAHGIYLNTRDSGHRPYDKNFQGYGTFTTGSKGEYRFRTIKPVPYSGRTAHIHFRVNRRGREVLTTQVFINGYEQNSPRRRARRHSRPAGPRAGARRFRAGEGIENQRVVCPVRRGPRPHAGGPEPGLGFLTD